MFLPVLSSYLNCVSPLYRLSDILLPTPELIQGALHCPDPLALKGLAPGSDSWF